MASKYYTPFLAQAGQVIGQGLADKGVRQQKEDQNKLAGNAYMGDPQAMQELMQVNPQLGVQVQQATQKRKEDTEQKSLQKRTAFKEEYDDIMGNIAKFGSFDEAKVYADSRIADIAQRFPEVMEKIGEDAVFDEEDFQLAKQLSAGSPKTDTVQSSKILPGGLVVEVMKGGAVKVVTPEQENQDKIKAAEERGAELQGLRAGERGAANEAMKRSAEAFDKMSSVRKTISLYDEGIRLIRDEGADTGAIESRFPSFKAASVELDNVQAKLGLNVIQNTTFGSLSTEELKFALSSTMPQGLDGPALVKWMERKRESQDKLATYLESAATFLGTPGNTIADFLRQKKTQQFAGGGDLSSEEQAELDELRKRYSK